MKNFGIMKVRSRARPCQYWHRLCQGSGTLRVGLAPSGTTVPLQARAVPSYWTFEAQFFSFS